MPHQTLSINGKKAPSATELTRLLPQDWLWAYYKKHVKLHGWRGWQWCNAHSARAMRLGTHTHSLVEAGLKRLSEPVCYMDEAQTLVEPERRMKLVRAWAKALRGTTRTDAI